MSSNASIGNHKEFIQHCYDFRINLQRVKNSHDQQNYQQVKETAIINFKKMIEIANQEANGNGPLRHGFERWLLWNYELNQEHSHSLMNEQLGFGAKCINELMIDIRKKKEGNKESFVPVLTEYEHAKGTLDRRIVRENQAKYVAGYFASILRKILAFDTIHMYDMHKDRLEEEHKYIVQRMQELSFSQLATNLHAEWRTFEKTVQGTNESLRLQNEEIDTALSLCTLDGKRTLLQQMSQKIGEIYERIRDLLRQIRNNAFTLKQVFCNPVFAPIESAKNIGHVFCHPKQTAKVAWEWMKENPGKTALLVIGTVGISFIIGAGVGIVGTALCTGTALLELTAVDFIVGSVVSSTVLAATTLTAVGGKAARESAITTSNAIDAEVMLRKQSLEQLNLEEKQYRQKAREAMREQRKKDEMERRGTPFEFLNSAATTDAHTDSQHALSTLQNDTDRLATAAQEMQFANEDVARELIETYQEERTIKDHLDNVIRQSQQLKEALKQNENNTIKEAAKKLVSILNEQDRFDDAAKTLDALKKQDYEELGRLIDQFTLQNNPAEDDTADDIN